MHYLLTHYDIPVVDPATWRLARRRPGRPRAVALAGGAARAAGGHARRDARVRRQRARAAVAAADRPAVAARGGRDGGVDRACRCAALLEEAGVADGAVEVLFRGLDRGVEGGESSSYERSLSLAEAPPRRGAARLRDERRSRCRRSTASRCGSWCRAGTAWRASSGSSAITLIDRPFEGYQQARGYRLRQTPGGGGRAAVADAAALADGPARDPGLRDPRAPAQPGPRDRARARLVGPRRRSSASRSAPTAARPGATRGSGRPPRRGRGARGRGTGTRSRARTSCAAARRTRAGNAQPLEPPWNLGGYATTRSSASPSSWRISQLDV